jgi:hypothetical protein
MAGPVCSCLDQLVDKFTNTLEEFSLFLIHYCNGELDICFNGHRLASLCSKLSHLQSLHFAIQVKFMERPSAQTLLDFTQAFQTPFWLNGPLGRIRVCVNYHQIFHFVQIVSLPYKFPEIPLYRTIDLIDAVFNTNEDEKKISNNLSMTLEPLWCGMKWLFICLMDKQKIPISFFHALQCSCSQSKSIILFFKINIFKCIYIVVVDKVLIISQERGVLPDNIQDHIQFTHFTTLHLKISSDINDTYDLQRRFKFVLSFMS